MASWTNPKLILGEWIKRKIVGNWSWGCRHFFDCPFESRLDDVRSFGPFARGPLPDEILWGMESSPRSNLHWRISKNVCIILHAWTLMGRWLSIDQGRTMCTSREILWKQFCWLHGEGIVWGACCGSCHCSAVCCKYWTVLVNAWTCRIRSLNHYESSIIGGGIGPWRVDAYTASPMLRRDDCRWEAAELFQIFVLTIVHPFHY